MSRRVLFPSRRAVVAGALVGAAGLAACGQNAAPVDEQGRVRLRLVLDGPPNATHGGFYQAVALGHYERRNLNVEIMPGGPTVSQPELLASGSVELAVGADSFAVLSLIASGAPVRAVAAYFQKDTHVLVTPGAEPIEAMAELAGQPILMDADDAAATWPVLANLHDLPLDQSVVPDDPAAVAADAQSVRLADLRDGPPPPGTTTLLADLEYPGYGSVLLAPDGFARDNATALRSFIIASAEGWRDYLGRDPAPVHARIRAANPDISPQALTELRQQLTGAQIVQGGEAAIRGIGVMSPERWRVFTEAAVAAEVFPQGLDWRAAYTLDYLPGRR